MAALVFNCVAKLKSSPRRNCYLSLPQAWLSAIAPSSVHAFILENTQGIVCFVSWAGDFHQAESEEEQHVILCDKLISFNGFATNETVIVRQIPVPLPCDRITASVTDLRGWDNLCLNSDIAQLQFLEQIRVVYPGQKIPLWLEGGVCTTMTVLSIVPSTVCGLLLPLSYVEVIPPSRGGTEWQDDVNALAFSTVDDSDDSLPTYVEREVMSSGSVETKPHSVTNTNGSLLGMLVQAVTLNCMMSSKKIVPTLNPRISLQYRVTPMPELFLRDSYHSRFNLSVIISRESVINTFFRDRSFFVAKLRLCDVDAGDETLENASKKKATKKGIVKKPCEEWFCTMIMVWENYKCSHNLDNDVHTKALDKQVKRNYMLIPDTVRRFYKLRVSSVIQLQTETGALRSDQLHADVYPTTSVIQEHHMSLCEALKQTLHAQCQLSDVVLNYRSLYRLRVHGEDVDVVVMLRCSTPVRLTRESVSLLTVLVVPSIDKLTEMPAIPLTTNELDKPGEGEVVAKPYVGSDELLRKLNKSLLRDMGLTKSHIADPKFALLEGDASSGKTSLVRAVCQELSQPPHFVHCIVVPLKPLIGKKAEAVEQRLVSTARRALHHRPSLLILDDLDQLCPASDPATEESGVTFDHRFQMVAVIKRVLYQISQANRTWSAEHGNAPNPCMGNVYVLATCVTRSSVDARLSSFENSHLFSRSYRIPSLSAAERIACFTKILSRHFGSFTSTSQAHVTLGSNAFHFDETELLKLTEGFKLPDLNNLAMRTAKLVSNKPNGSYEHSEPSTWTMKQLINTDSLASHSLCVDENEDLIKTDSHRQESFMNSDGIKEVLDDAKLNSDFKHSKSEVSSESLNSVTKDLQRCTVTTRDVAAAAVGYTPVAYKGLPSKRPSHTPAGSLAIGGLHTARQLLTEALCWPAMYPQLFTPSPSRSGGDSSGGVRQVTGLMLYGPPGCGKTRLAQAMAQLAGMNNICVKGPELLSKYIGQSEENVREAFVKASQCSPCLLFFDEFDSLAPRRGHDSTGVTDRVVNQLLAQLDGVEGRGEGVYVLAATCRPDLVDPALLRPGRLEKCVYCPLPSESDRAEILEALAAPLTFADTINWDQIATITPHLSGADLQSVLTTAQIEAVREAVGEDGLYAGVIEKAGGCALGKTRGLVKSEDCTPACQQLAITKEKTLDVYANKPNQKPTDSTYNDTPQSVSFNNKAQIKIKLSHVLSAVQEVKPSVSESERQRYENLHQMVCRTKKGTFATAAPGNRATLA